MRILYVCHQFFPQHVGGTELYTYGLARRMVKAGHETLVLSYRESPSPDPNDFGLTFDQYREVPTAYIEYNLSVAYRPVRAEYDNPEIMPFLEEIFGKYQPDLIHHTHSMKVSGRAISFFAKRQVPSILTLTDFWAICPRHTLVKWNGDLCQGPKNAFACARCLHDTHGFFPGKIIDFPSRMEEVYLWVHRFAPKPYAAPGIQQDARDLARRQRHLRDQMLRADHLIVLSAFQKKMLVRNGFPGDRLELRPHGLETEGLQPKTGLSAPPYRMTFIGSLVPHKGLHMLLKVIEQTKDLPFQWTIYGEYTRDNLYQATIREAAGLLRNVRLAGTFPSEALSDIMAVTDVLVMPAQWYENEPLVIKAALYCRIPVMASDIGSLSEMVNHGSTGWLLPPENVTAWVQTLNKIHKF